MKILLTGYKGFIGTNMFQALKQKHEVVGFDWSDEFPDVSGFDWVIHLGAISATTEKDVEKVMRHNYDFSVALYEDCVFNDVNMQYASTAQLYGLGTDFRESAPVDPRSPYAWSKYLFERYVRMNQSPEIIVQGFRYFNVYGPNEERKGDQASPFTKFRKQKEELGYITVFEPAGKYKRDFVHVDEVIDCQIKFLDVKESGVWNIGTGKTMSFLEVAQSIGGEIREIPIPEHIRPYYQEYTCADMSKTKETLLKYNV
jgi:ADP-L-glycero-D-manno-heptose 6-epimerase